MKKYMVRCDIEGVSGVVSYDQAEPGKPEYAFGQRMFMADLLALLAGLKAGGADEVVIYDEHYYGRNIDLAHLPGYARAICGKPPYTPDWPGGLDDSFAGVILLGFHSKADTPGGLLPHSYELEIANLMLNGVSVGEIGMEAAIAGDLNIPTLMVAGDSAGVAEAEQLLPGIIGVSVKESISETGAICWPLSVSTQKIRSTAADIVRSAPEVKPYNVGNDVTLEVTLRDTPFRQAMQRLYAKNMKGDSTLVLNGNSANSVWADYWQRKLQCHALIKENS